MTAFFGFMGAIIFLTAGPLLLILWCACSWVWRFLFKPPLPQNPLQGWALLCVLGVEAAGVGSGWLACTHQHIRPTHRCSDHPLAGWRAWTLGA